MKYVYRQQCQGYLSHPNGRIVALEPEEDTGCVKSDGIKYVKNYERDAVAIEVLVGGPIMASRVEIANHIAGGELDRLG